MGNCFSSVNDDDGCRASARERRRESRRKGESLQSGCLSGPPGDAASSKEMERRVAAYLAAEQQRDGQLAQLTNRGTANGFVPRVPRATSGTESTSSENISCSDSSSERSSTSSNSGGGGGGGGGMQLNCSMFSLGGQKGINQDSMVAWQSFAGPASVLCAVMDGHGRFGHTVSARVRDSFPSLLARRLFPHAAHERSEHVLEPSEEQGSKDKSEDRLEEPSEEHGHVAEQQWREAVCGAFEAVDHEVKLHPAVDPLISGSTAVVAMVQHDHLFLANLGDSRAVLARRAHSPASWDATSAADVAPCHSATSANATGPTTISPAHCQRDQSDQPSCHALEALALTSDHKCSDPTEAARIRKTGGRVEALEDEKHVQRIWLPNEMAPGLVTSRAVGDFLLKGFGVTCEPDVTVLPVDDGDEFIILATDGVWDVLSHEEAVSIVATSPSPATSAERLVTSAQEAWAAKYPKARRDDCTAVVLFLRTSLPNLIPDLPCPGPGEAGSGEPAEAGEGGQCVALKSSSTGSAASTDMTGLTGLTGSTGEEVKAACSSQEASKGNSSRSSSAPANSPPPPVVFESLVGIQGPTSSGSSSRRNSDSSNSSANSNRESSSESCNSGDLNEQSTDVDSGRRNEQSPDAMLRTTDSAVTPGVTTAAEGCMPSDAGSDAAEQCFTERHGDAVFTDEGLRFHRNDTVGDLAALDWQDEQVLAKRTLRRG